ncbi:hypothetical protein CCR75_008173 [Bremia lactucae]|uniref:RxLR effector protein n=1 Tax=Bremia lactucae TaxID=4779 RepID=A0A976IEW1_BRELC|nr:hypothetical protein CCR75_008173 [Bremia lactucae]
MLALSKIIKAVVIASILIGSSSSFPMAKISSATSNDQSRHYGSEHGNGRLLRGAGIALHGDEEERAFNFSIFNRLKSKWSAALKKRTDKKAALRAERRARMQHGM